MFFSYIEFSELPLTCGLPNQGKLGPYDYRFVKPCLLVFDYSLSSLSGCFQKASGQQAGRSIFLFSQAFEAATLCHYIWWAEHPHLSTKI